MDPLAEKKPFLSAYVYCRNNPMVFIDPDGRDEFEVSSDGRSVKVADNTSKDIVYSLNKKGERINSREYDYNTINLSSAKEGKSNFYFLKVKGDDQAKNLFEFLTTPENFELKKGQNVEWSRILTGVAGEKGTNFLTTSQNRDKDAAAVYLFDNQLTGKNGYTIRGHDHNHPSNEPTPSGTGGFGGDIAVMKNWKKEGNVSPYSQFRIFTPGLSKKYNTYNEKTTAMLKEITITFKK